MPTIKSHAAFRPVAEACFGAQVYPDDWQVYLFINENETDSLGRKLNCMCSAAWVEGIDYIVLWDDDDWYRKDRVFRQVLPLTYGVPAVSGTSQVYYRNGAEGFLYSGNPDACMYGLAFPTAIWEKHPFEDVSKGVDTRWLKQNIPAAWRFDCNDPSLSIGTIHQSNTCPKHTVAGNGAAWIFNFSRTR
jgi:hypothetical protein